MTEIPTPPERIRVYHPHSDQILTEQSHKNEVNVNTIMRKAIRSGLLPQRGNPGFYGDFSNVSDYFDAVNRVKEAENNFMTLPANIRKRFDNEPGKLLSFLEDASNKEEAIQLGILPAPAPEPVQEPIAKADTLAPEATATA